VFISAGDGDLKPTNGEKMIILDVFDFGPRGGVFAIFVDGGEVDDEVGKVVVLLDEG
jgi:hypothetical protein